MNERFGYLKAACGGSITIEALKEFRLAMFEYEEFMSGMRELFEGPEKKPPPPRPEPSVPFKKG